MKPLKMTGRLSGVGLVGAWFCLAGCQWVVDDADREVYRLIEQRQQASLGAVADATIDRERVLKKFGSEIYSFAPRPTDPHVPAEFLTPATTQPASVPAPSTRPTRATLPHPLPESVLATTPAATAPAALPPSLPTTRPAGQETVFNLSDSLRYATRHAREYQFQKEDLYLAALALTLERHLWSPHCRSSLALCQLRPDSQL